MTRANKTILTKIILLSFAVFIVVWTIAYLSRNWVRATVMPAYVSWLHKAEVEERFDQEFTSINSKLSQLGFSFEGVAPSHSCPRPKFYRMLSTDLHCVKWQHTTPQRITTEFVVSWQQSAAEFENYILSNGWDKEPDKPIGELYNNLDQFNSIHYSKAHGDIDCQFSITNGRWPDRNRIEVSQSCWKFITLFEGLWRVP